MYNSYKWYIMKMNRLLLKLQFYISTFPQLQKDSENTNLYEISALDMKST